MKIRRIQLNLLVLCITFLLCFKAYAQKETKNVKIYKVWVKLTDGTKQKGFLYAIDAKSLQIIGNLPLENESEIVIINAKDISQIKINRKGKIGISILIGGLSGIALGGVLGLADGDDPPGWFSFTKEEKAMSGVMIFGVLGTSIGALVGTGKEKFNLKGNEALFKSIGLENYAIVKDN
jgi:small nuclear ribonucleoprotein (snRNP)-like protein